MTHIAGLLSQGSRVVAGLPHIGNGLLEGLVIDDYFAVAVSSAKDRPETLPDVECFNKAKAVYDAHSLLGSSAKDVIGEKNGKVVGAQINASDKARDRGIVTIGSPPSKRFGLSWITLLMCQLPFATDVLLICILGAWVSILMYRRPLMAILNKSFRLVDASLVDASNPS